MKLLLEGWRKYLNEQGEPVPAASAKAIIHFMKWLVDKTERVHSKPGQGSIFAMPIDTVVEKVKELAASASNVDEIANGTGVLSMEVPGIGYDLVASVVDGKPVDKNNNPIEGELTTAQKEEGRETVSVKAVVTDRPCSDFSTDTLTIIVRPMKDEQKNVKPGEYIILSAFPGTTGADERASAWGDKFVVVIPKGGCR